jgi:hypothetical protein
LCFAQQSRFVIRMCTHPLNHTLQNWLNLAGQTLN